MFESCVCVREIRSAVDLLYGWMNAVCAGRHSNLPHVSSTEAVSRLPVSNTKSTAGTRASLLSFFPLKSPLVSLQILQAHAHMPVYRDRNTLELPIFLKGLKRTIGGLTLLSVSLLYTQKLIDSILARDRLIFIESLGDLRLKTV